MPDVFTTYGMNFTANGLNNNLNNVNNLPCNLPCHNFSFILLNIRSLRENMDLAISYINNMETRLAIIFFSEIWISSNDDIIIK